MLQQVKKLLDLDPITIAESELSKEAYEAWSTSATTVSVMEVIHRYREYLKEMLAVGTTLHDSTEITIQHTNKLVGVIEGLDMLLRLEYGEAEGGNEDGEESSTGST